MSGLPWQSWLPGVLSKEQVTTLITAGLLQHGKLDAIAPSSIDLHLTDEAYCLAGGSIKPAGDLYHMLLVNSGTRLEPNNEGEFQLDAKNTYVFKISERLPSLRNSPIYGQATAKSSVGRMDVLARLIVDGEDCYEGFSPNKLSSGDMWLEVTPITFAVIVKAGISLSQLRLFCDKPEYSELRGEQVFASMLIPSKGAEGYLSVDLTDTEVSGCSGTAFQASFESSHLPVRLFKTAEKPDPAKYWKLLRAQDGRFKIEKDSFYILRSVEKLAIPAGVAVYCRAVDETIGEMRIHYAGFVHPHFGLDRDDDEKGTPLIFEVRGHSVDVSLAHSEKLAKLTFYRMSKEAGSADKSPYGSQTLKLSAFFGDWPQKASQAQGAAK